MPTYDYHCDACAHTFEEFQSMLDKPLKKCPKCKKPKLRRLLGTGAAILFKGSGFYQTDYRSESYKSAAKREESQAASSSNGTAANGASSANGTNKASDNGTTSGTSAGSSSKSEGKKAKSAV